MMSYVPLCLALTIGNFMFAALVDKGWKDALKISIFQCLAVACCAFAKG